MDPEVWDRRCPNLASYAERRRGARCRELFVPLICALLLLVTAPRAEAQIADSAHDFSELGWSDGEICKPCHTPHHAQDTVVPLWNREASNASYNLYDSPTMDMPVNQPGPMSIACLSCHDGTVALDRFGGQPGGGAMIPASADLTTDLSDDHPVGVQWQHQVYGANPDYGSCSNCHPGGTGPFSGEPVNFFNRRIECPTCHDVHNTGNFEHLLVMSNAQSALCQHCHLK